MKEFNVTLTTEGRQSLHDLIALGNGAARKLTHARSLLKAEATDDGLHWPDWRIADALEVNVATVERVRRRFIEQALTPPWNASTGTNRLGHRA